MTNNSTTATTTTASEEEWNYKSNGDDWNLGVCNSGSE